MALGGFRRFFEDGEARVHNSFGQNTQGLHNDRATASFLQTTWTGSEAFDKKSPGLPSTDLQIPHVTRRSKIRSVHKNENPIKVMLMDGTTLYMTLDEFNRVNSRTKLEPGREISVTFQRREDDGSPDPSQVIAIG